MKEKIRKFLFTLAVVVLILSACAPRPTATSEPSAALEPRAATEAPASEPPPTLAPINLGGPLMEVGATYSYVDGSTLVAVPGGEFIMGYGNEDNLEHKVMLGGFWIYRDEVTNAQYSLCVFLGKCSPPETLVNANYEIYEHRNDPATGVRWEQAQAYCEFVNGRLPTEAEWEKAARGPDGNVYPWGNAAPTCELTNAGNCNPGTTAVTQYPKGASYYGAGNMAGNIFEWVGDWFDAQYYRISPVENPLGPEAGAYRSVRSSAFRTEFYLTEVARRFRELPDKSRDDLGFRCVVEDPSLFAPWCEITAVVNPDESGNGPGDISLPVPSCPDISVVAGGFCNKDVNPHEPAAILNFGADPLPSSSSINFPAGCAPDGITADPTDYYCSGPGGEGLATIQAECSLPPPPAPPECPPGYTQNGNLCEYTGGLPGGQCLPGVSFAVNTQCCQAIPGATDSFTLCPADAPYYVGGVCMPWPLPTSVSQTASVGYGSCGSDDDGDACEPPANGCPKGTSWNAALCCCYYQPVAGGPGYCR